MSWNPFGSVTNYAESMLNKIAVFTFVAWLGAITLLRSLLPGLDAALAVPGWDEVEIFGLKVALGTVLLAFVLAILFHVVKAHDRISDLFRIRSRFDVDAILKPMALATGVGLSPEEIRQLPVRRKHLMGKTFYVYASSTPGKAVIDQHAITIALSQWSWYWIIVESCCVAVVTGGILLGYGEYRWAAFLLAGILMAQWLLWYLWSLCAGYALSEILLIVEDEGRRRAISVAFREV